MNELNVTQKATLPLDTKIGNFTAQDLFNLYQGVANGTGGSLNPDDLKEYAKGQIVHLPSFADGQPLIVRMKRPSLMILAKSGKIPNKLLKTATEMFNGEKSTDEEDFDALSKTLDLLEIICEASLVEPKYKDL